MKKELIDSECGYSRGKTPCEFCNDISETLLIPLYMRAKESRRQDDAILHDPLAQAIVGQIEYDYSKFDTAKMSEIGCAIRCRFFDDKVRDFIRAHAHPVIVNIGCGLDARYQRTVEGESNVSFYSLDLPETISLRRRFIPEASNETYLSQSMFETGWMERIRQDHPDSDVLLITEGVIMYFDEATLRQFFNDLCTHFDSAEIWFDTMGTLGIKKQNKHDALKKMEATFRWGLNDGRLLESWNSRLHLIEQISPGRFFRSRQTLLMRALSMFPRVFFRFYSYVGYRIM